MGVLDFLFEGKPPPSVTQYGQTVESMPKWMSDYTQGLVARANAIAAEPYQPYGGPRIAGLTDDHQQAYGNVRSTVQQGQQDIRNAQGMPGALTTASPYLTQAGRTFPQAVDEYMDPYIGHVLDRNALMTQRALDERLLPSVARTFGTSGQDARSSAYRRAVDTGVRDLTEGLQSQNLAALSQGYGMAGQLFNQDATRLGALGQTAGNLALEDQRTSGALAQVAQDMGLKGSQALEAVGSAQQQQEQRNLDLAYDDFQRQRDYPRETVDWMSSVIRGIPYDRQQTTTQTGPGDAFQPSPLAQLGSLGSTAAGLWELYQNRRAKGGRVRRHYNEGGALRYAYA